MPPFSGKQKKKQLQEKRQRKKQQEGGDGSSQKKYISRSDQKRGQDTDMNADDDRVKSEYKYGGDRKGIRSVFLKETSEEIAERKRRSYEPLAHRRFMDDNGIPFGSWFNMPGEENAAVMPFAVDMPTRGWKINIDDCESTVNSDDNDNNNNNADDDKKNNEKKRNEVSSENATLEAGEMLRFDVYLKVLEDFPLPPPLRSMQLNSYERNLDVWRQLWRTVEQSDVVVVVCDVRYPILHLPLSLMYYIVRESKKSCLVLLNKADLVPKHILDKWMSFLPLYFKATGVTAANEAEAVESGVVCDIPLLPFTSLPAEETAFGGEDACNAARRRKKKKRRTKLYEQLRTGKLQVAWTPRKGGDDSEEDNSGSEEDGDGNFSNEDGREGDKEKNYSDRVTGDQEYLYAQTDNFTGMHKAERELQYDWRGHKELQIVSDMISSLLRTCRSLRASKTKTNIPNNNTAAAGCCGGALEEEEEKEGERPVHIGLVGHPNVGKSSLLNCIRGTKVVSVSATPGHTKHLQTIPIPSEQVVLIDSPGLVFPVFGVPRAIQAVVGTHQIAQTRDPQSGVAFLASHLPLERLYGMRKVDAADETVEWSSYELCESYAKKKGYFVKHGKGALDVHRGAIEILQEAYEGRLVLFFSPPENTWLESTQFREEVCPYLLMKVTLPEKTGE